MNLLGVIKELCARPMVLIAVGLTAGILAGNYGNYLLYLSVLICLLFMVLKLGNDKKVKDRRLIIFFLIILSFLTGIFRIRDLKIGYELGTFPDRALKDTEIIAKIADISFSRDQYIFTLENPEIKLNETSKATLGEENVLPQGDILVYSETKENVKTGDEVCVKGSLYAFAKASNYGQFDQREYYLSKGICLKLYADDLRIIDHNVTLWGNIKDFLKSLSMQFQKGLGITFDEKDKGILSAMLAGNRSELDDDIKNIYSRVGIAHVLSISGLHITLLGMGLYHLLLKVSGKLKFSIISACSVIFLYAVLTGFSISTTRALIMIVCMLAARYLGKAYDGQSAAGLAAVIILLAKPSELFESGFQLSFIAVFGIYAGNEIRINLKIRNKVIVYLIPAISAQIATLPVILRTYYSFSPYSILANIILIPFMPVIVVPGFLSGVMGALYLVTGSGLAETFSSLAAGPAHYMLKGYEMTSKFILGLPGSDMITGSPEILRCLMYYAAFFGIILMSRLYVLKCKGRILKRIMVFLAIIMPLTLLVRFKNAGFYTSYIDVGQGLSVYIEADGTKMLFDGGSSNVKNVGDYRIEPFLLWRGTDSIDYCFVSHTDEDHISGIRELILSGRIKIKKLVLGCNYTAAEPLAALGEENGIDVIFVKAGDIIDNNVDLLSAKDGDNIDNGGTGKVTLKCFSPDPWYIYEDKNQASLVLRLDYGKISMLLTGDSDEYVESVYLKYLNDREKINILQCPHHGSKYSCSKTLLDCIRPDVTVISCSLTNVYGHPSQEVLERLGDVGSEVYVTRDDGMITIRYDGNSSFDVEAFCDKE